ncbi:regulator of telomere elongation helicase 1-like [Scleropages formosus]|uniref:Regulator of telomere elongation helicase 1 n=1 Tax=Scleropages formosus TaxID=113540 RepID=A0A0P7TUZ1_SCLFO|nr:regulator of telomere elongation helicase 1-like [Scleropages formosus]
MRCAWLQGARGGAASALGGPLTAGVAVRWRQDGGTDSLRKQQHPAWSWTHKEDLNVKSIIRQIHILYKANNGDLQTDTKVEYMKLKTELSYLLRAEAADCLLNNEELTLSSMGLEPARDRKGGRGMGEEAGMRRYTRLRTHSHRVLTFSGIRSDAAAGSSSDHMRKMPQLNIRGIVVDFPFTPYPCQQDYMSKVIECLQYKVNGILESPTGTGKTLCLLCASLAWRDYFKDTISARKIAERMGGAELFPDRPMSSWGTSATDGDTPTYYTDIPKIIYASRTHSQLTQVINELKNTTYRPKVCVLGSREQLCINPEVMRQESNHVKVHMCRAKISSRSCIFYNNVEEKSTDKELVNSILDVEDLVKAGNKNRVCPYYLSRSLKQQADIIFMPYNYLLDPKSRRAHNIELKGTVVIFDEAHNVEKICEESTSFDLTPYDLASAIEAVDKLLLEQVKEATRGEVNEDFNLESLNSEILLDLEAAIDSFELPSDDKGITKPGSFIYELFQKAHLTFDTKAGILEALDQIVGYLAGKPGIFLNTSGLQKLSDIIQLVFCVDPPEGSAGLYVHIHKDYSQHKKKQKADVWASSSTKKQGNILSYWCFSPGFSMQELVRQGVRSIILTSGTLSPLGSFTAEMQIPFPVSLENPHVIQRDQIFVSVIDKGPDNIQLSSAFERRFLPENMASLGNTVVNLGRVIPHGLLVFFPSYPVMEKTLEFWKANGHADRIENMKPMFVEPKGKGSFTEMIEGYYGKVNDPKSKGGSFFAVCRGKASEGLDFADTFGRGVIITGLPFPPRMDPRIILKMEYLNEMCRKANKGIKEWYRQQASRAVNQAIGRVIRHREDYGAIFLCDYRFKNSEARSQLPSWVRPYVRFNDSFGNIIRDVAQFFRVAQKLRPPPVKKVPAAQCGALCSSDGKVLANLSSPALLTSSMPKAKLLDFHMPSLKRRRPADEPAPASGMAGVCLQYELQMESGRRKPMGLLDALESSDSRIMEEEEHLVGEEQKPLPLSIPEETKAEKAKAFLQVLKESLSQVHLQRIMLALQKYKKADSLQELLDEVVDLFAKDSNTYTLLREFYQFIRPHHKKKFDEACQELTGLGCGYKPEHSLSKEEREKLMHHTVNAPLENETARQALHGSSQKSILYATFISDIKRAIGVEKSHQFFSAVEDYKKTDNYDNMISKVVSLLTEKAEDFSVLKTFGMFVRPHHKQRFLEMFSSLTGTAVTPEEKLQVNGSMDLEVSGLTPVRTQSKISSYFTCSDRK